MDRTARSPAVAGDDLRAASYSAQPHDRSVACAQSLPTVADGDPHRIALLRWVCFDANLGRQLGATFRWCRRRAGQFHDRDLDLRANGESQRVAAATDFNGDSRRLGHLVGADGKYRNVSRANEMA